MKICQSYEFNHAFDSVLPNKNSISKRKLEEASTKLKEMGFLSLIYCVQSDFSYEAKLTH